MNDLPKEIGFYLWYIHDMNYFDVGCVQILQDPDRHVKRLKEMPQEKRTGFYLYQTGFQDSITLTMYHQAHDHLPPCDKDGKPLVDGWIPFDFRTVGLIKEPVVPLTGKACARMSPEDEANWLVKVKADSTPDADVKPLFVVGDQVQVKTGLLPGRATIKEICYYIERGFTYYLKSADGDNDRWEKEEYLELVVPHGEA